MRDYKITLNGKVYTNISTLEPKYNTSYAYDIVTMNGNKHREVEYVKKDYSLTFFNDLKTYDEIRAVFFKAFNSSQTVQFSLGVDGEQIFDYKKYYVEVTEETERGYLSDGSFYRTGLKVELTEV